jgi:hypothetical protein
LMWLYDWTGPSGELKAETGKVLIKVGEQRSFRLSPARVTTDLIFTKLCDSTTTKWDN